MAKSTPADPTPLYDIIIVPTPSHTRLGDRASGSLIRHMAVMRLAKPVHESLAETWGEVYCDPAASSHELFIKGINTIEGAPFKRLTFRMAEKPIEVPLGEGSIKACFFIAIQGTTYQEVMGPVMKRIQDILAVHPSVYVRPHMELSEYLEVPEDELPKKKVRRERSSGVAGTMVEEF